MSNVYIVFARSSQRNVIYANFRIEFFFCFVFYMEYGCKVCQQSAFFIFISHFHNAKKQKTKNTNNYHKYRLIHIGKQMKPI